MRTAWRPAAACSPLQRTLFAALAVLALSACESSNDSDGGGVSVDDPRVSFTAARQRIDEGESATLVWSNDTRRDRGQLSLRRARATDATHRRRHGHHALLAGAPAAGRSGRRQCTQRYRYLGGFSPLEYADANGDYQVHLDCKGDAHALSDSAGRYLQPDPLGIVGGLNAYLYAGANPVMLNDPYGRFVCGACASARSSSAA